MMYELGLIKEQYNQNAEVKMSTFLERLLKTSLNTERFPQWDEVPTRSHLLF